MDPDTTETPPNSPTARAVLGDVGVAVRRKINYSSIRGRSTGIQGKVKPGAKTKIKVLRKAGKKYKKFKTVKTKGNGKFLISLPAPRRGEFKWKIVFKGGKKFASTTVKGRTYRI